MTTYILFGIGAAIIAKYTNFMNKCVEKYHKFRELNKLVSTQYSSNIDIFWISSKIAAKSIYLDIFQTLNKTVTKIGKNKFEITYILNEQEYKFIVEGRRGPKNIVSITDENYNNVTDKIEPYLGPKQDFHNRQFTPNCFGYERLNFEIVGGNILSFNKYDLMDMNKIPHMLTYS